MCCSASRKRHQQTTSHVCTTDNLSTNLKCIIRCGSKSFYVQNWLGSGARGICVQQMDSKHVAVDVFQPD